jgi:hypothetical protein
MRGITCPSFLARRFILREVKLHRKKKSFQKTSRIQKPQLQAIMSGEPTSVPSSSRAMSPDTERALHSLPSEMVELYYRNWAAFPGDHHQLLSSSIKQMAHSALSDNGQQLQSCIKIAHLQAENNRLRAELEGQRQANEKRIQSLVNDISRLQTEVEAARRTPVTSDTTRFDTLPTIVLSVLLRGR